jgi:hypothetical protein
MEFIKLIGGEKANDSYLTFLEKTASEAESVIGLVAYWTAGIEDLPTFINLISREKSFVCVDPSSPTNLELLLSLNNQGNNFYAFKYEVTGFESKEGLLHSKVYLFDNSDDTAVLIIGSHNTSKRALYGTNIEHSMCLRLNKHDGLYKEVRRQICDIKYKYCIKIEFVDKGPGGGGSGEDYEKEIDLIIIVGDRMEALHMEKIISVFYKNPSEAIKTNETPIYVLAYEVENKNEYLYRAVIKQSGSLDKFIEKSAEIEFGQRRYAEKDVNMIPFLFDERQIPEEVNKTHTYFNTIQIEERIEDFELYYYKEADIDRDLSDFGLPIFKIAPGKGKIYLSPKINQLRIKQHYSMNFEPINVKSYYLNEGSTLFPDSERSPNFSFYPIHKRIRKKMFLKRL